MARKLYPDTVKIVNPDWLFSCLSNWAIVDEKEYLVATENPKLWKLHDSEVEKYKKVLEERANMAEATHIDSIDSFDEYDLDEANQEVDDFLAGLSDDDEDDDDDEEQGDLGNSNGVNYADDEKNHSNNVNHNNDDEEEEEEEEEIEPSTTNGNDSFIKNLYSTKKRSLELEEDNEEEDNGAESNGETSSKKQKVDIDEEFLDDLEKELLDGFDDLEE